MLAKRLYQTIPPDAQSKQDNNPTLLVSWWCTLFALTAILVRAGGRYVRTEKLFKEDKIMLLSIIPLLGRMGLVHVILIWGTNNTKTEGLSAINIQHREVGSKLVLASRIFYAAFIWTAKFTVSEFLKRIIGSHWRRSYELGLQFIRYFLAVTFVAVIIATLTECQPFDHYWQVVPDPGPKCREGFAQLITMGVCDMITDVLLVIYPIPIVIASHMPIKRKISLALLFMLSLGLVGITAYRIPAVIDRRGAQQFRTLLASLEILAATAVSNSIVIGSFIRDRGAKKAKYRFGSTGGSSLDPVQTRRTNITMHHWGSDADLVSDIGISLQPELHSQKSGVPRPAPIAVPGSRRRSSANPNWQFPQDHDSNSESDMSMSTDPKAAIDEEPISPGAKPDEFGNNPRKLSFFDVGGLLEQTSPRNSSLRTSASYSTVTAQDFASGPPSTANSVTPLQPQSQPHSNRRHSRPAFADVGGLLSSHREESPDPSSNDPISLQDTSIPRNSSRSSQSYPATSSRFSRTPTVSGPMDEDGLALSHTTSGGTTTSLIAALATIPPGYRPEVTNNHLSPRASRRRSNSRQANATADGMELMDAGGLLR